MKSLRQQILETFREQNFTVKTTWLKTNTRLYGNQVYYLGFPTKDSKRKGLSILQQEDFSVVDYDKKGVLVD